MWKAQTPVLGVLISLLLLMGASMNMTHAYAHSGEDKGKNEDKGSNDNKGSNEDKSNDNKGNNEDKGKNDDKSNEAKGSNDNKGDNEDKGSNEDKRKNEDKGNNEDKAISGNRGTSADTSFIVAARGTGSDTSFTIVAIQVINDKTILSVTGSGVVNGDFRGTYSFYGNITIDARGNAAYQVVDVCECTIMGKSGIVVLKEEGNGIAGGQFRSDLTIVKATGDLFGLSGKGKLQGTQDEMTLLTSWTYVMQIHGIGVNRGSSTNTSFTIVEAQVVNDKLSRDLAAYSWCS